MKEEDFGTEKFPQVTFLKEIIINSLRKYQCSI
jgi:hypothetical protein